MGAHKLKRNIQRESWAWYGWRIGFFTDLRMGEAAWRMTPSLGECGRPGLGGWVTALAVSGDWLVCGGGPELGLWHLGSRELMAVLRQAGDVTHHALLPLPDRLLAGSSRGKLSSWTYDGRLLGQLTAGPATLYSLHHNQGADSRFHVTTAAGSSPELDLFISPAYKAFSLHTMPNQIAAK